MDWLRGLSPPLRLSVYFAGAILAFFVAVGVGAAAAVVAGWQSGRVATGPGESSTLTGSKLETTSSAKASEDAATEQYGDPESTDDTAYEASFVHRATEENSRGDYTYISDPSIDGDENAIVLVSNQKNAGGASYKHNIGVWYTPVAHKWAIFNQDLPAVPAGATFEVRVPQASTAFVHHADLLNTAGNYTYLDNRLTNGKPDAVVSVTQNWNPGGGGGVYNDHPVGIGYDAEREKWKIYNEDGSAMPEGAAFNVTVSAGANEPLR